MSERSPHGNLDGSVSCEFIDVNFVAGSVNLSPEAREWRANNQEWIKEKNAEEAAKRHTQIGLDR